MKLLQSIILSGVLLNAGVVFCASPEDAFKDITAENADAGSFFMGFETEQFDLARNFTVVRGEGINGTRGLCYKADQVRKKIETQVLPLELKKNWNYRLTVHFRLENGRNHNKWLSKQREFAVSGLDFFDAEGKYLSGRYRAFQIDPANQEYQVYHLDFNTPKDFDKAIMHLYMPILWTGTIYFDDISIQPHGAAPGRIYQIAPKMLHSSDGQLLLRADNLSRGDEKDLNVLIDQQGKRSLWPIKDGKAAVKLDGIKTGRNDFKAAIVNVKSKELFGWQELSVFNYKQAPRIQLDNEGNVYKDGKKILLLGVFAHSRVLKGEHLPEIHNAGFNFIMTYRGENLRVAGVGEKAVNRLRAGLDLFQKNDLMMLFAVNGHLKSRNSFNSFSGAKGYENSIRKLAAVLKNHPALLGWYTSDENPLRDMPEVSLLRNLLMEGDGLHPVVALTNKARDVADFAATGDMIMLDDYPFVNAESKSMASTRELIEANRNTGVPSILVPQGFHWGAFRKPAEKFRFPTELEIRSQTLLGMILGCKGICFYSYTAVIERQENAFPGTSKAFLEGIFRISRMLKELEPFFLSSEKAPEVKIDNRKKSRVDARAFVHGGKIIVPITADGPGDAEADIRIDGVRKELKSRFGFTRRNADGSYTFAGKDVISDILEGDL